MKISIITITLNSELTIRDTLNSVLSQTYNNIEHIIVDGGSTDATLSIIKRYPNKNKRLFIKKKTNIYEAMNYGIKKSTGKFIAILNSDDLYQNNKVIEEVGKKIKKNKHTKIFLGNLLYFKNNDYYKVVRYYTARNFKPWMIKYGIMPPHPASFISRDVYFKHGLYKENFNIASDFDLFLRFLYIKKIKYTLLDKTIVRMRTGGVSGRDINSYITTNREIHESFKLNMMGSNYLRFLFRIPSKIKQLIFFSQNLLNKNFTLSELKFDKERLFIDNFNIINKVKDIPLQKNFILSGMNLAFLGYYSMGTVFPFKNLYHWPDGIFLKKFLDINKIPGRQIINQLKITKEIKKLLILGSISSVSKEYLKQKFKLPIRHIELPYAPIEKISKKKIKLDKKTLTLITLPTPKQEEYAYVLAKNNINYKIICIGASIAIASNEEKAVPKIFLKYEFIWRLRTETLRRTKRLLETYFYFNKKRFFSNLFKKTSFRIYKNK